VVGGKERRIGGAILVALLTVLVYFPALQNGFVNWDDQIYVYKNSNIWALDVDFFKWMFRAFHASNWHPLTWLSHGIDYAVWGLDPLGHHLTSIVLHGLNTFLVVILITRLVMLRQAKASGDSQYSSPVTRHSSLRSPLVAGAVTGLLFGVHLGAKGCPLCFFLFPERSLISAVHLFGTGEKGSAVWIMSVVFYSRADEQAHGSDTTGGVAHP
jgi:hypothetical protein